MLTACVRAFETLRAEAVVPFYELPCTFIRPDGAWVVQDESTALTLAGHLIEQAISQGYHRTDVARLAVRPLAPGFMRTERVVEAFRRAGMANKLDGPGGPSETTAYLGRAVFALATDPRVIEKSGQLLEVGALAREYGFTDISGTQPPPFRMPQRP
jgi:hypothetical protein